MSDNIVWDSVKMMFVVRPESEATEMYLVDDRRVHLDGPVSPEHVNPDELIGLLIKHNRDIRQGWEKGSPIEYDEKLLRDAIETYNDKVERKFRESLRNRNR